MPSSIIFQYYVFKSLPILLNTIRKYVTIIMNIKFGQE
ncbi:hypothetical protein SAAL107622_10060 [Lacicoccus alkaliphilus]